MNHIMTSVVQFVYIGLYKILEELPYLFGYKMGFSPSLE